MPVRNSLVMDHFYLPVSVEDFAELVPLVNMLTACTHQQISSGDDHWEGLYLQAKSGSYFEILRARRLGGFGLAWTARSPLFCDVRRVTCELPDEPWKSGTRLDAEGKPWFDWISTGDYLDVENQYFNSWIMYYHPMHMESSWPPTTFAVDSFKRLKVTLGQDHLDELLRLARWSSARIETTATSVRMFVSQKNQDIFLVDIELTPDDSRFVFKSLELQMARGFKIASKQLGPFTLTYESANETLVLARKPDKAAPAGKGVSV